MGARAGSSTAVSSSYTYLPRPWNGRVRPKHKWLRPEAGFEDRRGGESEGMCPAGLPAETVEALLNGGVEHYVRAKGSHPAAIFNVHEGIPYKAYPTEPGRSYHGFPCRRRDVPPQAMPELLALARRKNCELEVKAWFRMYP